MTEPKPLNLVWIRDDLRIEDHPALSAAMQAGASVACYVLDETHEAVRPLGAAARWWLHHALLDLGRQLATVGVPLLLFHGASHDVLQRLVDSLDLAQVHWNRRYGSAERDIDARVKRQLKAQGIQVTSHSASLLAEPWQIGNAQGEPYKVFAAFHRRILDLPLRQQLPAPPGQPWPVLPQDVGAVDLSALGLLSQSARWGEKLARSWVPGETAARQRMQEVIEDIAGAYSRQHDRPDLDGTSRLSPALRWGHVSPVQVFRLLAPLLADPSTHEGAAALRRQVVWRDFCWHLLYHFPQITEQNFRREFDAMDWAWPQDHPQAHEDVLAWQDGRTGYGLVDAGMRQLWQTGWMHNRVRMVVASFLVKNLQIHWKVGERWFWDTLVDADAACNTVNWQWVAGSGTDAAPYFRVFNPLLQAKKFDPNGSYVARYAPLGAAPIVDLKESRARTLGAYARMRAQR